MNDKLIWAILGIGALFLYRNQSQRSSDDNRALYMPAIDAATAEYGLPAGLLEKLLDAESAFRSV